MNNYRKVFVRDYRLEMIIGVHPHEHEAPQAVLVDVDLFLAESVQGEGDELSRVLNYECIPETLERVAQAPRMNLLETLADRLLEVFLEDVRVQGVQLSLKKPDICPKAAALGYEVSRFRD